MPQPGPHRVLRSSLEAAEALTNEEAGVLRVAGAEIPVPRFSPQPPTRESTGAIEAMPFYAGQSAGAVARDPARRGDRRRACARPAMNPDHARLLAEFGLGDDDAAAWARSGLPAEAFQDWLTDRVARRPAGARAREVYGAEDVHDFARRAILDALDLGPGDRLLEIGCGGGLLLRAALTSGATATGLDHSDEMVRLARERAPGAEVVRGNAEALPFADAAFTAVAMSVVLLFLPDPVSALRECHRVLERGGRVAIYTTAPELRGTPAAPEPLATRSHFHDDEALAGIARAAGFDAVVVANDGGGQLLEGRA